MRGREAGAGTHDAPAAWLMQAQMPGAGPAHRKAPQYYTPGIQKTGAPERLLGRKKMFNGLVHVRFAGPAITIVAPPINIQAHKRIFLEGRLVTVVLMKKLDFIQRGIPPM